MCVSDGYRKGLSGCVSPFVTIFAFPVVEYCLVACLRSAGFNLCLNQLCFETPKTDTNSQIEDGTKGEECFSLWNMQDLDVVRRTREKMETRALQCYYPVFPIDF